MIFQKTTVSHPRTHQPHLYNPEPKEWSVINNIDWLKPIIVDVGCGKGAWVVSEAKKNPNQTYIGIERTLNKSKMLLQSVSEAKLANLIGVRADAVALIHQKFPKASVSELHFFYPNPTPKRSQANKRFFVSGHFQVFHEALKTEGLISLVTNIYEYADEARAFLHTVWGYQVKSLNVVNKTIEPRTDFEKKYLEMGQAVYELIAEKQ